MKHFYTGALLAAVVFAGSALAQDGRYGPDRRYAPDSVSALIDRVHGDLNRSYEGGWTFTGGDRHRLDGAEKQLRDFARKWYRGKFDKGELDDAIGSIQHVLDNNHMPPRDRAALDQDVNQLRGMREAYDRHELFSR
jgi:hypothetical protein